MFCAIQQLPANPTKQQNHALYWTLNDGGAVLDAHDKIA